ncbi:hypothetical protein BX600DRAFT_462834 [Xylariales sp. PMI_506]|nr:hypothetical protein BX600DRAFT_462834 [Xylariales sp. PMI_506]
MPYPFGTIQAFGLAILCLVMQAWPVASTNSQVASELFTLINCDVASVQDWDVVIDGAIQLASSAINIIETVINSPYNLANLNLAGDTTVQLFTDVWWMWNVVTTTNGISNSDIARLQAIQANYQTFIDQLTPGTTTALSNGVSYLVCDPTADVVWTQNLDILDPNQALIATDRAIIGAGAWYLQGQVDANGVPYIMWPDPTQTVHPCNAAHGNTAAHAKGEAGSHMLVFCDSFYDTLYYGLYSQTSTTSNVDQRKTMSGVLMHEMMHWLFAWKDEVINWPSAPAALNNPNGLTAYDFALAHFLGQSLGISPYFTTSYQCDVNPDNYRVFADMAWAPTTGWAMP